MEAKFKVEENCYYMNGDGEEIGPIYLKYPCDAEGFVFGVDQTGYSGVKYREDGRRSMHYRNGDLLKKTKTDIKIGSTWYWQGEKDSPVTVIGFDSKGRVVVESGFEDGDDPTYLGEVFAYGGATDLEGPEQFLAAYQPTVKPKKLTGYVRVLKAAEGYLLSKETGDHIFQSAVFSDEAKARTAAPYGFEVVDVVKVEWEQHD